MKKDFRISLVGIIHSPYKKVDEVTKSRSKSVVGQVEVFSEYQKGLGYIEGFSHLIIVWIFHKSKGYSLRVNPLHHEGKKGVFATKHPNRPNPVGVTVVELLERRNNFLKVKGIDAVDGSPLIDIKPYTKSDQKKRIRTGWLEKEKRKIRDRDLGKRQHSSQ